MNKIHHIFKSITTFFKKFTLSTPVAILFGAVIVAGGLVAYGFIMQGGTAKVAATMFTGKVVDEADYIGGKINSKVVVVEYSDPECPYCISVYPTIQKIRTDYASKVAFVYRHFPLTSIHPHAFDESKAIQCAGIVGGAQKHFEYIDALFGFKVPKQSQTNSSPQLPATGKEDLAKNIGLDVASFTSCMNDPKTSDIINTSMTDGAAAGVQGTPSTFVLVKTRKGYEVVAMVDGARPEAYFKAAIDEALNK
ncbi:MAG: DsbA family protein [Candidatus Paceibacterota bacterium]